MIRSYRAEQMSNSRSRRHHNRAPLDERSVDERSGAMMEDERLPAMVDRSRREQGRGSRPGTTSPAPSSIWSEDSMSFRDFRSKSPSSVSSYAPSRPLSSSDVDRISSANTTRARTAPLRTSPPATSTFFGGFGGGDGSSLNGDAFPFSMQTVQRTKAKLPTLRNPKLDWSRLDELEKPQTQSTVTFQDKVPEQQRDLRYLEEDDLLRREFKLQPKAKSKDSITMVDVFGANVPQFLLRYFLKHRRSVKECDTVQFDGVVMVINLLGFEPMAEKCSSHDAMRVHELKTTVNAFYGSLVRIIVRDFGGDVLAIEGEDIVAIFGQPTPSVAIKTVEPHNNTQKGNTPKAGRSQPSKQAAEFNFNKMMHIALQCALEIQQSYGETILNNTKVSLRAAVGAGKLNCLFLGGVKGVWHYVLASDVLVFLSRALLSCPPGEVVVPSECWQHAAGCQGTRVSGGEWSVISVPSRGTQAFKPTATRATSEIIESIRPFIPLCVLDSLDDGYGELASAMRRITCVHLTINNMCFAKTENPDCFRFQQLITNVQRIFYHAGGTIHSISMSHSSTTLIILFGIPPTANTDDPARAVKATIHAKNALNEARLDLSVGISTGSVFCGSLGIPLIREQFVVLGSVPSLALLLAGVANEHGGVIVDEKTYELARDDVDFESRKATLLEGLFFPVPIYRPKGFEFVAGYDQKIIARDEEKALMRHELRLLLQGGDGRVIVFEGDKGVGKTALLLFVLEQAEGFSIRHLSTSAEHVPHSQHKPFAPFAILIRQMFGGQDAEDATIRDNLMTMLKAESPRKWFNLACLLNYIGPFDIPVTKTFLDLPDRDRFNMLPELLFFLLRKYADEGPYLLCFDNGHDLDRGSWEVVLSVARRVPRILIILATRPMKTPPPYYGQILRLPNSIERIVHRLTPENVLQFASKLLDIEVLPETLKDPLAKCRGNPMLIEEVLEAHKEAEAAAKAHSIVDKALEIGPPSIQVIDEPIESGSKEFDHFLKNLIVPGSFMKGSGGNSK